MSEIQKAVADPISFIDLRAQQLVLGARIIDAVARVVENCQFIMGPEVGILEDDLGKFCGASEVISCANGTDALALVLMAKNVMPVTRCFARALPLLRPPKLSRGSERHQFLSCVA